MEADAYILTLRHGDKKYKTMVHMGFNDMILYKKEAGGNWSIASQEWPAVTLTLGNNLDTNSTESSGAEAQ